MNMYAERTERITSEKDKTGVPRRMKAGFEHSSGFSFDDVRVHYNSEKSARYIRRFLFRSLPAKTSRKDRL